MGKALTKETIESNTRGAPIEPTLIQEPADILPIHRKKVLFVTSELADLVKVGGLGDVSAALPRALSRYHWVRAMVPGYPQVINSGYPIQIIADLPGYAALPPCQIGRMTLEDGLTLYVVICPELYDRPGTPYGDSNGRDWPDNHIRFARFGLAAAALASGEVCPSWQPDLVHAHDWPAALTPAYMTWRGQHTPTVFTVHNLAYQGLCEMHCAVELGLPPEALGLDGVEFYGKLSFLKAGLTYADHITTVSKTYALEITAPEMGCGLHGLLSQRAENQQLSGFVNGIDKCWDPQTDSHLIQNFSAGEWEARHANTRYVEQLFGLQPSEGPLFAIVSRLVEQKGLDLLPGVIEQIIAGGGRLVVLGQGQPELEQMIAQLAQRFPEHVGFHRGFNEADARRMFAGSDFLLMPSRYEPCGLSQSYAQCFGSLPIAHRTGGLADTIEDDQTGFLFDEMTADSFAGAIERALNTYLLPPLLEAMRCMAMQAPQYWLQAAKPYAQLYHSLAEQSLFASLARPGRDQRTQSL
ncbi:glycogen synthase GlgA [Pseudomonas sp. NyZ704]|nr:glycogen synthase GlgA [Pseudomonas sp. NyZ704]